MRRDLISFLALSLLPCCAVTRENPDGSMTVRGFVSMTIERSETSKDTCRSLAVGVNTIGVSVFKSPETMSANIGYQSMKHVRVKDDCIIIGDPLS